MPRQYHGLVDLEALREFGRAVVSLDGSGKTRRTAEQLTADAGQVWQRAIKLIRSPIQCARAPARDTMPRILRG